MQLIAAIAYILGCGINVWIAIRLVRLEKKIHLHGRHAAPEAPRARTAAKKKPMRLPQLPRVVRSTGNMDK
jgi:hypothetical protein